MAIEIERDADGRWIAQVPEIPGAVVRAETEEEARRRALALALRIVADRIERGDSISDALLAAVGALHDGMEREGGSRTASRVLSTVLKIGDQVKRQRGTLRALSARLGSGRDPGSGER